MLVKGSNEEKQFIKNLIQIIKNVATLEEVVQLLSNSFHAKSKNLSMNILDQSILQDISKPGGMKNVDTHLTNIVFLKALKTGKTSKAWSRNQSVLFLMTKLKKLQTKNAAHGNS